VHVKEWHIEGWKVQGRSKPKTLRNSADFFQAAKKAGFTSVITSYRENILEKEISSYELAKKEHAKKVSNYKGHDDFNTLKALKEIVTSTVPTYDRTYVGALMAGYDVGFYSFTDVVTHTCRTINKVVKEFIGCSDYRRGCNKEISHTQTSHLKASLSQRIGKDAARNITASLKGTPFEWMLDVAANEWPKDVKRPLSSIPMPLLSAGGTEEMRVEFNRRYAAHKKFFHDTAARGPQKGHGSSRV
jgi:hypothetical protein